MQLDAITIHNGYTVYDAIHDALLISQETLILELIMVSQRFRIIIRSMVRVLSHSLPSTGARVK